MPSGIELTGLSYCYQVLDMHNIECENLFRQDTPEALVLAILSDFRNLTAREVVQHILRRLQELTGPNEAAFREYLLMLEILSSNRDLKQILKEEENMISQVKYSDLPSFDLGMEQGLEKGLEKGLEQGREQGLEQGLQQGILRGETAILKNQLQLKFGNIPDNIIQRLQTANSAELLYWSERILISNSLTEIFAEH